MKRKLGLLVGSIFLILVLTSCNENYLPPNEIDANFEQDFVCIEAIANYLLSQEEYSIFINCETGKMADAYGNSIEYQSSEIKKYVI